MMYRSLHVIVFAFLLGGQCAAAAGAEPAAAAASFHSGLEQLTLHQAEIFFAARNRELQLGQRLVEGAEADRLTAGARPNPSVFASASKFNSRQGQYSGSLRDKQIDTVLGVQQLFERGNKRELRLGVADANIAASRGEFADVRRQQQVALHTAYFDLLAAQERVRIGEDTAASFRRTVEAAERRFKAGDIAAADVARVRVDALRAQNDARTAQAERAKAQAQLAYLIGAEREATIVYAADGWPAPGDVPGIAAIDAALDNRADVIAARARVAAAERSRDLARALRTRDVTGSLQFEHFPGDFSNNTFGVGISIPLFVNHQYEGEIRRAEVDLSAARDHHERVRALAQGEIAARRADLDAARERVLRFDNSLLQEAQRAAEAAEYAHSRGATGVMDLLDARRQFYATRLEAVISRAEFAKSLSAWKAATAAADLPAEKP